MKRICIIGHFGGNECFTDGQTVKVRSLYEGLKRVSEEKLVIDKVDTYYLKKSAFKLCLSFLKCLLFDKIIIFLPATNGRRVLFKLLYFVSKIFKKEVYHDCIGGALVQEIKENPKWIKYLNAYKKNWMESDTQARIMFSLGIHNASYLPNFKHISPVAEKENDYQKTTPFKFCTFSRVLPEKGIGDAIDAVSRINEDAGKELIHLDIFGPIQESAMEWFNDLVLNCSYVSYCGVIDPQDSVATIKNYYMLLFPTQYYTEGMPGTIIDAMFAGVPVIARRWIYCDEMIQTGYNGLVYDFDKPELLIDTIRYSLENIDTIIEMRKNCVKDSIKYSETEVVSRIIREMGL